MEIEARNSLGTVDVQLSGHAVQVGQVQLDAADGHHAGQEEVHVAEFVPGDLRRVEHGVWQPQREVAWYRLSVALTYQVARYH